MNPAANALLFIGGVAFGTMCSSLIVSAWTGPSSTAPNGNVSAPLNVGSTAQVKNGSLGVNSLAIYGDAILAGTNLYLNFGTTAGSAGYGIRDNAGTLEFKNTGGSWNNFTNSVLNILGADAITSLKFSDGTAQTTSAGNYLTNGSISSIKFSDGTTLSTATSLPSGALCGMDVLVTTTGQCCTQTHQGQTCNPCTQNSTARLSYCKGTYDPQTGCPSGWLCSASV